MAGEQVGEVEVPGVEGVGVPGGATDVDGGFDLGGEFDDKLGVSKVGVVDGEFEGDAVGHPAREFEEVAPDAGVHLVRGGDNAEDAHAAGAGEAGGELVGGGHEGSGSSRHVGADQEPRGVVDLASWSSRAVRRRVRAT